jgi:L-threonylcarbamoyladenylate synthase
MEVLKLSDVLSAGKERSSVISAMRDGSIIVYPTDTIYGIGCDAGNADSVEKLRRAKGRDRDRPFSVIAPGKGWIWKNCAISAVNRDLADKMLPGPYTIITTASPSAPPAVVLEGGTLGVRLPNHPFTALVEEAGIPLVTTSVNMSGEKPVTAISDIPPEMHPFIVLAIDAGEIDGNASRIFDFTTDDIKVVRR